MARRRIRPILIGVPLVFAAWFIALVGVTLFQAAGKPVAVLSAGGMNGALAAVIAADGHILQVEGGTVIAISDDAGFVARLYRAGAALVVAASPNGCFAAVDGAAAPRRKPASPAVDVPSA